ncbi:hypothetical protein BFJ72_g15036 [Fusarium proliferatum]|uniref:DUF2798 domain-containing protein n=1 Tax=Gibberella intermedia TaxID=948311 RepID=A0A420RTZ8_GIBIN|nr:hypothetical protein BFJ72_g15036 [Fusarium proliferatum]
MQTKDQPDAQGQMRRSTDKSFAQDRQAAGAVHFLSARRLPSRADTSAIGSRDRRAACGASPLRRNHARMTGGRSMASRGQCRPHTTGLPMKNECPPSAAQARTVFGFAKLPAAYATLVMPLLLSILMTFVVSAVSTLRSIGLAPGFLYIWLSAWALSWIIAFPTLLFALPLVRRATAALVMRD